MRFESSVTSVSWIPSQAVSGLTKAGFTAGIVHYDDPPPDAITDLAGLPAAERFRLPTTSQHGSTSGWERGDAGYGGRGYITCTRLRAGSLPEVTFQAAEFPKIRATPEISATGARFTRATGGRTGAPFPRPVSGKPYFQWGAPTVWTTLALTLATDGTSRGEMTGASPFPRHWVTAIVAISSPSPGWHHSATGSAPRSAPTAPGGQEDSKPLVTIAESAPDGSCRPPSCMAASPRSAE
jgi:hypothetical protein